MKDVALSQSTARTTGRRSVSLGFILKQAVPSRTRVWPLHVVLLLVAFAGAAWIGGCHTQNRVPVVEFTTVPPAAQGGRERVDTIAGRVSGARPGQQIVVYARSGPWWVQLWPDKAFIPIKADSTWSTPTHLGFEYAALLVEPGYHPPPTMDTVPVAGGSVIAVAIMRRGPPWRRKSCESRRPSGPDA